MRHKYVVELSSCVLYMADFDIRVCRHIIHELQKGRNKQDNTEDGKRFKIPTRSHFAVLPGGFTAPVE